MHTHACSHAQVSRESCLQAAQLRADPWLEILLHAWSVFWCMPVGLFLLQQVGKTMSVHSAQ